MRWTVRRKRQVDSVKKESRGDNDNDWGKEHASSFAAMVGVVGIFGVVGE
jgi:hypothetical protein